MAKTNKELRSDLAKEMRDKYNEADEQLQKIDKSPFSEWVKTLMKQEIMNNFGAQTREMKNRPWYEEARRTYLDEIKAKKWVEAAKAEKERLLKEYEEKLAKADEDIAESNNSYENAQIAHRGKVEDNVESKSENYWEIPQELKKYRRDWGFEITSITGVVKDRIIKAAENIPVKIETDRDGSRLIEFKLWEKTYKILDPKLENHTDDEFRYHVRFDWIQEVNQDYVKLRGMISDNIDSWENEKLKSYIKGKQGEWLYIPDDGEMLDFLKELWEDADLPNEEDQIAMFMYLTGIDWDYRLGSKENSSSRFLMGCRNNNREIRTESHDSERGNFLMMSVK